MPTRSELQERNVPRSGNRLSTAIWLFIAFELILFCIYARGQWILVLLWSVSILLVAATVGFLFAVPRSVPRATEDASLRSSHGESERGMHHTSTRYVTETNLEGVSDWIAKGLIIIAVINVQRIPFYLNALAIFIAGTMPSGFTVSLALVMIITFSIIGFVGSYLITRLYMIGMLAPADLEGIATVLTRSVDATISSALMPERLDNYSGYLVVAARTRDGEAIPISQTEQGQASLTTDPRDGVSLVVWLQRSRADGLNEPISITDGNDTDELSFDIQISSLTLRFEKDTHVIRFSSSAPESPKVMLSVMHIPTSEDSGHMHMVRVQLLQKKTLIHLVSMAIKAREQS